jgi:hypothetical protein
MQTIALIELDAVIGGACAACVRGTAQQQVRPVQPSTLQGRPTAPRAQTQFGPFSPGWDAGRLNGLLYGRGSAAGTPGPSL